MTLYKRGNIWWYNFTHKEERYQSSTNCKNRKDAARVEKDAKKAVILQYNKQKAMQAKMTVADAVAKISSEEYAHSKDGERSIRQLQLAVTYLPKGRKYVNQITREDVILVRDQYLKDGNKPQTANKKLAPFRKMLKLAANDWQVAPGINMPKDLKFTTKKRRVMEKAEEEIMLEFFDRIINKGFVPEGYRYKQVNSARAYEAMFIVYIETGMRLSELTALEKDDIQWLGRYLTVRDPKNGQERDVPVTERCERALKKLIELFGRKKLVVPINSDNVSANLNLYLKDAGLKGLTVHCLRHTFITRRIAEGVPTMVVKELAGHKSVATTEKYAKVSMQTKQMAVGNGSKIVLQDCSKKRSEKNASFWTLKQDLLHSEESNPQ